MTWEHNDAFNELGYLLRSQLSRDDYIVHILRRPAPSPRLSGNATYLLDRDTVCENARGTIT